VRRHVRKVQRHDDAIQAKLFVWLHLAVRRFFAPLPCR